MPLIAELFFDGRRLQPTIVFCTNDEYENYMSSDDLTDIINSNRISSVFFKEYLKSKGFDDAKLTKRVDENKKFAESAVGKDELVQWSYAPTLTVKAVKNILTSCQLNQDDFFDEHCKHLKSL